MTTEVLVSEQRREESQRELGDRVLPAWKMEEGPRVKERRQTSKSWKRQTVFPLELPEGTQPYRHCDFSPMRSMLDF